MLCSLPSSRDSRPAFPFLLTGTDSMLIARRFFRYFFLLFLMHYMSVTMFRAIGGLTRNLVVANACGSLFLLIILLMGGFVLAKRAPLGCALRLLQCRPFLILTLPCAQ